MVEYFGYIILNSVLGQQPKKVEKMLAIEVKKTKKQLRGFLWMINYYKDMWRQYSTIMMPLTEIQEKCQVRMDAHRKIDFRQSRIDDFETGTFHLFRL